MKLVFHDRELGTHFQKNHIDFSIGHGQVKYPKFEQRATALVQILINPGMMLVLSLLLAMPVPVLAAEKSKPESLETHLFRLGYGVAVRKKDKANRLLLDGALNGKKVVFMVDTGWGLTALDERSALGLKTAKELGVVLQDPVRGLSTNSVVMEKLALGNGEFSNQPASVQRLEMDSTRVEENGILGIDFLLRNYCLVDCGLGRLYFRGTARTAEESRSLEEHLKELGFVEVPMPVDFGFNIAASINKVDVRLLVDTGAFFSVLDESQITRLSLKTEKVRTPDTGTMVAQDISGRAAGVGDIGVHRARVTTPVALWADSHLFANSRVAVANLKSWGVGVPERGAELHGMLGEDLLIGAGALIDCAGGKLWFRPVKTKAKSKD